MDTDKKDGRMRELISHLAAEYLSRNSNRMSLITVTGTTLSTDRKNATIFISVLPESEEKSALEFAKRKRSELREYLHDNGRFSTLPILDIVLDKGEKNRQRIDELSRE